MANVSDPCGMALTAMMMTVLQSDVKCSRKMNGFDGDEVN